MFAPRLVMMEGLPGSGKSTLAGLLVDWVLAARGQVDHLPEEAIFSREEFDAVGRAFETKRFPTPDLMLAAYERIFQNARGRGASVIADWNSVGMIEDLPCAQPDRSSTTGDNPSAVADAEVLRQHAADVRHAWGGEAVLLRLVVPAEDAIRRAADQRGREWVYRELSRAGAARDAAELSVLADWYAGYGHRREAEVQAHVDAGWTVRSIDATAETAVVLRDAVAATYPDA